MTPKVVRNAAYIMFWLMIAAILSVFSRGYDSGGGHQWRWKRKRTVSSLSQKEKP